HETKPKTAWLIHRLLQLYKAYSPLFEIHHGICIDAEIKFGLFYLRELYQSRKRENSEIKAQGILSSHFHILTYLYIRSEIFTDGK
ncbi:MAG: hypothetical protein K2Y32_10600, partial [Candidatus Obscuribacterales bacterium]|nr:hypothetical protein [Candidatus Obscuribacterales bacterium]